MGGKKRKFSLKTPPKITSQEEYDLKQSFSKLKRTNIWSTNECC